MPNRGRGTRQRRIAVLTPEAGGYYVGDVLAGIDETLRASGVQSIVIQTAVSWQASIFERAPIDPYVRLAVRLRSGAIAIAATMGPSQLAALAGSGEPLVTIAAPSPASAGASVVIDNVEGAKAAVRHLLEHGHRRVGFVGGGLDYDTRARFRGYTLALEEAGIAVDSALCFDPHDDLYAGGRAAADAIFAAGVPVSAAFVVTDTLAVSLIGRLRELGVRTPDDVAVIGFDDSELAQTTVPALTSVRQQPRMLGRIGAATLLDIVAGRPPAESTVTLPTALVRRHSCGCFGTHIDLLDATDDWARPDWQERLAAVLARALASPSEMPSGDAAAEWPGVEVVIAAFDRAIRGEPIANVAELDDAWRAASLRTRNAETLLGLVDLLEFVGLCRQSEARADPESLRPRLRSFLAQARLAILGYSAIADSRRHPQTSRIGYNVVRRFLASAGEDPASLLWLRIVDESSRGCLGLWEPGRNGTALRIARLYGAEPDGLRGSLVEPEDFPPAAWLDAASASDDAAADSIGVTILPVVTPGHEWGVLAIAAPSPDRYYDAHWTFVQGASLLGLALDAEARARPTR